MDIDFRVFEKNTKAHIFRSLKAMSSDEITGIWKVFSRQCPYLVPEYEPDDFRSDPALFDAVADWLFFVLFIEPNVDFDQ